MRATFYILVGPPIGTLCFVADEDGLSALAGFLSNAGLLVILIGYIVGMIPAVLSGLAVRVFVEKIGVSTIYRIPLAGMFGLLITFIYVTTLLYFSGEINNPGMDDQYRHPVYGAIAAMACETLYSRINWHPK